MDERRSLRVAEALREELAEMISYELTDPRIEGVEVIEVHVSPDLKLASIQVALGSAAQARQQEALAGLDHAKSFLKRELAARLELPRIPDLRFDVNPSAQGDPRMSSLLRRIRKGRPRDAESAEKLEKKPEP
jgi:ribosome-binding factor A